MTKQHTSHHRVGSCQPSRTSHDVHRHIYSIGSIMHVRETKNIFECLADSAHSFKFGHCSSISRHPHAGWNQPLGASKEVRDFSDNLFKRTVSLDSSRISSRLMISAMFVGAGTCFAPVACFQVWFFSLSKTQQRPTLVPVPVSPLATVKTKWCVRPSLLSLTLGP